MSEDQFNKKVATFFKDKLKKEGFNEIKLTRCIYILRDFTFIKTKQQWRLFAGFQEQDIVFYKDSIPRSKFLNGNLIKTTGTGLKGNLIIPLAICELKVAPFNTHAMITSSKIALDTKQIFPNCSFFFIVDTNKRRKVNRETIIRQGKGFNRVFIEWEEEKEIAWQNIKQHLTYLKKTKVI